MNLIKETWNQKDILEFQKYLKSFENKNKREWNNNILKTQLPVLVIATPIIKEIVKQIAKGNYLSFLDHMVWDYYENTAINGYLISKIKDFDTMKKYLDIYSARADNWATCDLLSFNVKAREKEFFNLAQDYAKNNLPFVRRIGINILFKFIDQNDYIYKIFDIINSFEKEDHYYVNMVNAWLLCDCFIKQRERTLEFFEKNKLNKFTKNKSIQKCRESHRVSAEDKEMLLKYKK